MNKVSAILHVWKYHCLIIRKLWIFICFSTNTTYIKHSNIFVIAWTHQFDFVLISLKKNISYIFEYDIYHFLYLIRSLSSYSLVTAARRDWNCNLIYNFIVLFISFSFSAIQLHSKFTVITLYVYYNACLEDYSVIIEQVNDVCTARFSFIYCYFMCICILFVKVKKKIKLKKWKNLFVEVSKISHCHLEVFF